MRRDENERVLRLKSLSVKSVGLAWIYGGVELVSFEGILFFITGDFVADTLWHSAWPMMALRAIAMALISTQIGYLTGTSAGRNEIVNGACSALLASLWLVVVFLFDRWTTSELYLVVSAAMPLFGIIGGFLARRENWSKFELPEIAGRRQR